MNNTLIATVLLLSLLVGSCTSTKVTDPPVKPAETTTEITEQINKGSLEPILNGKWTITRFSAFTNQLPTYEPGDVVYEFKEAAYRLLVNRKESLPAQTPSLPSGEYSFGADDCLLFIGESMFFYEINTRKIKGGEDKITLLLDTNIDPSISADGPVYILEKIH